MKSKIISAFAAVCLTFTALFVGGCSTDNSQAYTQITGYNEYISDSESYACIIAFSVSEDNPYYSSIDGNFVFKGRWYEPAVFKPIRAVFQRSVRCRSV